MSPRPFDPLAPIEPGITVLEASAGTGKTHSLSSLAVRYVADGISLDELLLVTFTRLATGEMRDRIWQRLVDAERGIAAFQADGTVPDDPVYASLTAGGPAEVELRRANLAAAVAEFDRATICTIHQFCHLVLSGLGFTGDVERDITFLEEDSALVEETIADLYVRKWSVVSNDTPLDVTLADRLARTAIDNPASRLVPAGAEKTNTKPWSLRRRFVQAVLDEVDARKAERHLMSFSDLLVKLRRDLCDPVRGAAVAKKLAERFRFVIVDEFQDTDDVQWDILRRAFGEHGGRLVLIGDPKQAIYAFRGADVHAYLAAVDAADVHVTLDTNWRSDAPLLTALDAVFDGARFGADDILYRSVQACPDHGEAALSGAGAPLRFRVIPDDAGQRTQSGNLNQKSGERIVAADLASDIARLLGSDAAIGENELRAGDIAVLVRTNAEADAVIDALRAAGVPAVQHGGSSVFATDAARDWYHLLRALELPGTPRRAHRVAITPFFGWSATDVAEADDTAWDAVHTHLHSWAATYRNASVAAMLDEIERSQHVSATIAGVQHGERRLADLLHVAELLHTHALDEQVSIAGLATWLGERLAKSRRAERDEQIRRLDVDHAAVEILTIHRAKGLEWPIVYVPFLWTARMESEENDATSVPVYHQAGTRYIDVGGPSHPDFDDHLSASRAEARGEDLRLAYVAMTRAKHQVVAWLGDSFQSKWAPLPRLIDGCNGALASGEVRFVPDALGDPLRFDEAADVLRLASERSGGLIDVEPAVPSGHTWSPPADDDVELAVRGFDRSLELTWVRTSYSSLTAAAHDAAGHDAEHDESGDTDEPPIPAQPVPEVHADETALRSVISPMAELPGGARFGTFVHDVMEHTDFAAPDLDAEVARVVADAHRRHRVDADLPALTAALQAVVRTPLGPVADGIALAGVPRTDRLDELVFELPLAGGDTPVAASSLADIGALWRRVVPADDLLAPYGHRLDDPLLATELAGYLTGSIDLVLRVRGERDRFVVIDHKTNWLGTVGEELSAWHHRPAAMAAAMIDAHYPLQALLYSVALYRYLRWRVPGDATESLGGVAYLFLRGMCGPNTPSIGGMPSGVFTWQPPAALVVGTSDLLAGAVTA